MPSHRPDGDPTLDVAATATDETPTDQVVDPTREPATDPVTAPSPDEGGEIDPSAPGTEATAAAPAPDERRRRRLVMLLVVITAVVLVLDQATKAWALATLDGQRRDLVGDLLGLQLVFNPGAALSIATGMTWVLTIVAVAVVVVLVRVARRLGSTTWAVALGLLLGGALGNLVDRLVRDPGFPSGHVIDFIAYLDWFVGNVADIAIVVAAGLVVLLVARGIGVDGSRDPEDDDEQAVPVAQVAGVDDAAVPATAEHSAAAGAPADDVPAQDVPTRDGGARG